MMFADYIFPNLTLKDVLNFLTSPSFEGYLLIIKIIVIVFSFFMLVSIIILLFKTKYLEFRILEDLFEFFNYRSYGVKKILKQWQKTKARLGSGLEPEYKLAVIEADSNLDGILKKLGYSGASMGERLDKINSAILPNIEEVRQAHKIRNNIIHDPDYKLSLEEAKKAILIYEKTLTDLGAL